MHAECLGRHPQSHAWCCCGVSCVFMTGTAVCTQAEYRQYIEKDAAFERRFQQACPSFPSLCGNSHHFKVFDI